MPRLNLIYGDKRRPARPSITVVPGRPGLPQIRGHGESESRVGLNGLHARAPAKEQEPEALVELDRLVGLKQVKELVREIYAYVEVGHWRAREKLATEATVLHMVFRGNPGTGKTTVARLLGRLFRDLGVLSRGHLVEVERADLVGEYIGHTAQRTREQVKKALGGVLFIDEAYSLARGGEKDFGREAIDTLVRSMEHHRNEFILIMAGYRREIDWFLRTNPGFRSRLPLQLDFPDYTSGELLDIARYLLARQDYFLSAAAESYLEHKLRQMVTEGMTSHGNARLVRNMLEKAMRRQAMRLMARGSATREELMRLEASDLVGEKEEFRSDPALRFRFEAEEGTPLEA